MSITMEQESLFSDPRVDEAIAALHRVRTPDGKQWPADPVADEHFVRQLLAEYPTVDLPTEISEWQTWLYDNTLRGKVNWRSRFRNWIKNGLKWDGERRTRAAEYRPSAHGQGGRSTGATPQRRADYGDTRRLGHDDW